MNDSAPSYIHRPAILREEADLVGKLARVRQRFRAASYAMVRDEGGWLVCMIGRGAVGVRSAEGTGVLRVQGKQDFAALFRHYDRDNSGELDFDEFRRAVRKDGKLTEEVVADADLEKMFAAVDADGGGSIGLDEFEELLGASGPSRAM